MLKHKFPRRLLGAAVFVGIAATTTPAQAASLTKLGSSCVAPGYNVATSGGTIYNVGPRFAWIDCLTGDKVRNVSRVVVRVFNSSTNENIICGVWGESFGAITFGPVTQFTQGPGHRTFTVNAPNSNQSRVVIVKCYLPPPNSVGSGLFSYTITTR